MNVSAEINAKIFICCRFLVRKVHTDSFNEEQTSYISLEINIPSI